MYFAAIDWTIVIGHLALSVGVGPFGKKYIGNVSHYLVAGRELGIYAGVAILAATESGTITLMYDGEVGYKDAFAAFATALISGLVMIIVGRTGLVVARFRSLKLRKPQPSYDVLRQESSPVEWLQVTGQPSAFAITLRARQTIPAHPMAGYSLRGCSMVIARSLWSAARPKCRRSHRAGRPRSTFSSREKSR